MLRKSNYWKHVNPTGAIGDLVSVFREAGAGRWRNSLIAGALTFGVFSIMATQSWKIERKLPDVTYINSWPADRTEAETRAYIARNQKEKEDLQARQAAVDAEAQRLWMVVGKATGVDVDKMKAQADIDKAKDKAKQDAETRKALEQVNIER
ncbi:MAG: hypothetical protein U1E37_08310 [Sphingomonadaceae bacterium]|jgi:hypothetical protein